MKVTEVTVSAARTFNHPYEDYSNLKPFLSLRAELQEGDDPEQVVKDLQAKAESLIEDHKQHMLESLRTLHLVELAIAEVIMGQYERKVTRLESSIKQAQDELETLRQEQAALASAALPQPEDELPY